MTSQELSSSTSNWGNNVALPAPVRSNICYRIPEDCKSEKRQVRIRCPSPHMLKGSAMRWQSIQLKPLRR
eukprot:2142849-Amphidinium_carterae.1